MTKVTWRHRRCRLSKCQPVPKKYHALYIQITLAKALHKRKSPWKFPYSHRTVRIAIIDKFMKFSRWLWNICSINSAQPRVVWNNMYFICKTRSWERKHLHWDTFLLFGNVKRLSECINYSKCTNKQMWCRFLVFREVCVIINGVCEHGTYLMYLQVYSCKLYCPSFT